MIKNKIIESIRGYLIGQEPGQDSLGKVNYQRIAVACSEVFDTLLLSLFNEDIKGFESSYVKDYRNQSIQRLGGISYLSINAPFVNLPEGRGIWYVKPNGSQSPIPRSGSHHIGMLASLPVGQVLNTAVWRTGFIVNSQRIIIEHMGDSIYALTTRWDYGLVRQFSAYADTEDVLIPKYDVFVNQVLQWFGKRPLSPANDNA
jgi:hypothetical protein